MGDARRFDLFAKMVATQFPCYLERNIADVAGGKGYLQAALRQIGFRHVKSWDKRRGKAHRQAFYRYGHFHWKLAPDYDLVVAMHPDEATDHVVMYSASRHIPAIICPCCIKPDASTFWNGTYREWCQHLDKLASGMRTQWLTLPMQGRNDVLIMRNK